MKKIAFVTNFYSDSNFSTGGAKLNHMVLDELAKKGYEINVFSKNSDLPFSAGNGAIVSIKPCAFLIKEGKKYKTLTIADNAYEKMLDKATEFMSQLKLEDNKDV